MKDSLHKLYSLLEERKKELKIFLFLLVILFTLGIYTDHFLCYQESKNAFFYQERPLLSTVDGYYYLNLVKKFAENRELEYNLSRFPSLLVPVTVYLHKLTKIHIEWLAFCLPAFFGVLTILVYYFWGNALGGFRLFFWGALLGMSHAHWFVHAGLGRFDPECFLIFFIYLIPFFVYRFVIGSFPFRFFYLFLAVLFSAIFHYWYKWGLLFSVYLILFSYAISVFFYKKSRLEDLIRWMFLAFFGLLIFAIIFPHTLDYVSLPKLLKTKVLAANYYLKKLFFLKDERFTLKSVALFSVAEYKKNELLEIVNNSYLFLVFFFLGILCLFRVARKLEFFLFLVPSSLIILAFKASRFLLFGVPFYALACAALLLYVFDRLKSKFENKYHVFWLILAIATVVFLYSNIKFLRSKYPYPIVQNCEVSLAVHGAKMAQKYQASSKGKKRIVFWNWWDYGYAIQYFTQSSVMANNGTIDFWRFFVIAYPLTQEDPVLAKNWMRYFARYGPGGLHYYYRFFKDYDKTVMFFRDVFTNPQTRAFWQKKYLFLKNKKLWDRLFPKDIIVIVYFPHHMYRTAYWWYYFGSWSFKEKSGFHPTVYRLAPRDYSFDLKKGLLYVNASQVPLKKAAFYIRRGRYYLLHRKYYHHPGNYFFFDKAYGRISFLSEAPLTDSLFVSLTTFEKTLGPALSIPFCGGVNIIDGANF